jgi:hypothetical protein
MFIFSHRLAFKIAEEISTKFEQTFLKHLSMNI